MSQIEKIMDSVLCGRRDSNISFSEMRRLLKALSFRERIRGDHYIYTRDCVEEIINMQPTGSMAKPYQVKQVRSIITKYRLGGKENE